MAPHNMQEPSASVPAVGRQARPVVFRHPWDAHSNELSLCDHAVAPGSGLLSAWAGPELPRKLPGTNMRALRLPRP